MYCSSFPFPAWAISAFFILPFIKGYFNHSYWPETRLAVHSPGQSQSVRGWMSNVLRGQGTVWEEAGLPLPTASSGPFLVHHYYFLRNKLALTLSFFVVFQVILGKVVKFPTPLDKQLQKELLDCSGDILTAVGDTMCTHDFYEGELKGRHL